MRHRIQRYLNKLPAAAFCLWLSACGDAEQGPACKAFVRCVSELDTQRSTSTNVERFQPGGACWNGSKGAAVCENACRRGITLLSEQEPALTCFAGLTP